MNPLSENPHYETADFAAQFVPSNQDFMHDASVAQVHATLALAYEQRTANLIAALGQFGKDLTEWPEAHATAWVRVAQNIDSRLGLEVTARGEASVANRIELAEAWDEGVRAVAHFVEFQTFPPNPYRETKVG